MNTLTLRPKTIVQTLWITNHPAVRNILLTIVGSLAICLSAKLSIPFWPVPLTMQTLVILMIGMAFGSRLGVATVLLYLAEGAAGLPVFSGTPEKGIGLAYMMNTTGGYLFGFILAAGVVGYLAERGWDRNPLTTAVAMLIGNIVIYIPGLLWLGTIVGWDKPVLAWGFIPFLAGDALKLTLAAILMPGLWSVIASQKPE